MYHAILAALGAWLWLALPLLLLPAAMVLVASWLRRWRRSRFRTYGFEIRTFHLPDEGAVQYAQWLHPKDKPKSICQEDVTALRRFVREGDFVIDVGAHSGDTTLPLALAAGRSGCTLALEPNPYVFAVLRQNAGLNQDKTHIVPLDFAATDTDGTFTFHYSDGGYCNGGFLSRIRDQRHGHRQPLTVQGRNLDCYLRQHYAALLPRLSFIKVDTEGYDRQVLASLLGVLQEFRPVVVCEVLGRLVAEERAALFALLDQAGYDCYRREDAADLQGPRILADDMMRWRHFDILALPRRQLHVVAA